jgi:thioredoxin reductase
MPDLQSQSSRKSFRLNSLPLFLSEQTQSGQLQETHPEKEQVLTYAEAHPVDEIIRKLSHHAEELHPKTDRDEAETAPELIHDYDVKCELAEERMRELYHAEKEVRIF